jgi:hypothetical protein
MPRKVVNLVQRKPRQPTEAEVDALERVAEANGNGIAGEGAALEPERPITGQTGQTGIIERPGRVLADGSRRGAKTLRRLTAYLDPELARRLRGHALAHDATMSDVIGDALDAYLGQG